MKILYRSYCTDATTDVNPVPVIYRIKLFNKITIWKNKKTTATINHERGIITFSKIPEEGATIITSSYKPYGQKPNRAQRRHPGVISHD